MSRDKYNQLLRMPMAEEQLTLKTDYCCSVRHSSVQCTMWSGKMGVTFEKRIFVAQHYFASKSLESCRQAVSKLDSAEQKND